MAITLTMMVAASSLLATSLRTRTRERTRSEALAATQRALNIMSREIGNSGYGLNDNGLVILDSSANSIRIRANLNNNATLLDSDEDLHFEYQAANRSIVRFDTFPGPSGRTTVLATDIDSLTLTYWTSAGVQIANPANYNTAERITIAVSTSLPGGTGQPASVVRLVSDVALRNAPNTLRQF